MIAENTNMEQAEIPPIQKQNDIELENKKEDSTKSGTIDKTQSNQSSSCSKSNSTLKDKRPKIDQMLQPMPFSSQDISNLICNKAENYLEAPLETIESENNTGKKLKHSDTESASKSASMTYKSNQQQQKQLIQRSDKTSKSSVVKNSSRHSTKFVLRKRESKAIEKVEMVKVKAQKRGLEQLVSSQNNQEQREKKIRKLKQENEGFNLDKIRETAQKQQNLPDKLDFILSSLGFESNEDKEYQQTMVMSFIVRLGLKALTSDLENQKALKKIQSHCNQTINQILEQDSPQKRQKNLESSDQQAEKQIRQSDLELKNQAINQSKADQQLLQQVDQDLPKEQPKNQEKQKPQRDFGQEAQSSLVEVKNEKVAKKRGRKPKRDANSEEYTEPKEPALQAPKATSTRRPRGKRGARRGGAAVKSQVEVNLDYKDLQMNKNSQNSTEIKQRGRVEKPKEDQIKEDQPMKDENKEEIDEVKPSVVPTESAIPNMACIQSPQYDGTMCNQPNDFKLLNPTLPFSPAADYGMKEVIQSTPVPQPEPESQAKPTKPSLEYLPPIEQEQKTSRSNNGVSKNGKRLGRPIREEDDVSSQQPVVGRGRGRGRGASRGTRGGRGGGRGSRGPRGGRGRGVNLAQCSQNVENVLSVPVSQQNTQKKDDKSQKTQPTQPTIDMENLTNSQRLRYKLNTDLFKMLKFVKADIFIDSSKSYSKADIVIAFRLLCERVGVFQKENSVFDLQRSDILSTIFKTKEQMGEEDTWEKLLLTKIEIEE